MVNCVKDFYIPPLLKTLAGVVFKRRQCRQVMERFKRGNGIPFPSCILVLFGWGGWRGGGGGNYVTWTRHMTIVPLK